MCNSRYRDVRQSLIDMETMVALKNVKQLVTPGTQRLEVSAGDITFEDVHFGFEKDRKILNGLSLHVPAGNSVAIVGVSGGGKSTLLKLL